MEQKYDEQRLPLILEPHPGILKYTSSPANTDTKRTYSDRNKYQYLNRNHNNQQNHKKNFVGFYGKSNNNRSFFATCIISSLIFISFFMYKYYYGRNQQIPKKKYEMRTGRTPTQTKNTYNSNTSAIAYLKKVNSILNIKLRKSNEQNIQKLHKIDHLKSVISRDDDIIDALKVKVVNPTNKNFHNNDNTQMKKNGAFLPYSPSTTKIKIRHNILNAVEEALAGG